MVDISTAMAAASTERSKRDPDAEKKIRRTGSDMGIESFDPVKHVAKEKAETASMWLVIAFSCIIALLMRYVVMGSVDRSKADILYALPLLCIVLIPTIHRTLMPNKFTELYKKGTWFKASFLYVFVWLALSFLLINPPFGDIASPNISGQWGIISESGEDGYNFTMASGTVITLVEGYNQSWLVMSFADNSEQSNTTFTVTLANMSGTQELSFNDTVFSDITGDSRTLLMPRPDSDSGHAYALPADLDVGNYRIIIDIVEQGDPWVNPRTLEWDLLIVEPEIEP
jgi:hypothetical protein